jgi:AcrR family transcriptional regulator
VRKQVLDAAERLLLTKGVDGLRLDAVAAVAGVSKGGLLHHFNTKQALIDGVLSRRVEEFDAVLPEPGNPPGAFTRAWLEAAVPEVEPETGSARDQVSVLLLSAVGGGPASMGILRERYEAWQEMLTADGIDPVVATLVRVAADGWWMSRILNFAPPSGAMYQQLRAEILKLLP